MGVSSPSLVPQANSKDSMIELFALLLPTFAGPQDERHVQGGRAAGPCDGARAEKEANPERQRVGLEATRCTECLGKGLLIDLLLVLIFCLSSHPEFARGRSLPLHCLQAGVKVQEL